MSLQASTSRSLQKLNSDQFPIKQLSSIQDKVFVQIAEGKVKMGPHEENICNPNALESRIYQSRLKEIKDERQSMKRKFRTLEEEQSCLKKQKRNKFLKTRQERSFFTEEDKQKIARIKSLQKQRESKIRERILDIMNKMDQSNQQQQAQKKTNMQMKKMQRLKQLSQKRHKTQQLREKAYLLLEKSTVGMKKQNYIYVKKQKEDAQLEEQRRRYASVLLQEKRIKNKVNFDLIKQHERQYEQIRNKNKEDHVLELRLDIMSRIKSQTTMPQSIFLKKIREQIKERKNQTQIQKFEKKSLREKLLHYQEHVSENFKPKINSKSRFKTIQNHSRSITSSPKQRFLKGNEYLQIAKRKANKKNAILEVSESRSMKDFRKVGISKKFPNYIPEAIKNSKHEDLNALDSFLKQKEVSPEKAQQAIKWVRHRDQNTRLKSKKFEASDGVKSAKDKLAILTSLISINSEKDDKIKLKHRKEKFDVKQIE